MGKVVRGGGMFFKDDIKIIDAELSAPLSLPANIPVFSRDELQIIYNGHIFVAVNDKTADALMRVYATEFALKEIETPKEQEDKYFTDNEETVGKLKVDFLERVVNGVTINGNLGGSLPNAVSSELIEKITQGYADVTKTGSRPCAPGKGNIAPLTDDSVFNAHMHGYERILLLDSKVYSLQTLPDYIAIFESSIKSHFYQELQKTAANATPQEVADLIEEHKNWVHRKAYPPMKNKIWQDSKTYMLYLDGTYWLPRFEGKKDDLVNIYTRLLERKVKVDAARESA